MQREGCLVVAMAKMLVKAGAADSNPGIFNPDIFFNWGVQNGAFLASNTYCERLSVPAEYSNSITFEGITENGQPTSHNVQNKIWENINAGKYSIVFFSQNEYPSHWAFINNEASQSAGVLKIYNSVAYWPEMGAFWTYCPGTVSFNPEVRFFQVLTFSGNGTPPVSGPVISDGDYVIASAKNSNYYLDIAGVDASNGTNVQLCGETAPTNVPDFDVWTVTYNSSDKFYKICQKTNNNMCLDVQDVSTANGANVQVWTYEGGSNQQWTITQDTEYGSGYRIMPKHTGGKSLDIVNTVYELTSGANIQIWNNDNSPVQSWVFLPYTGNNSSQESERVISDGDYVIASAKNSNYYLDIAGITASNGTNIQLTGETAPANVADYDVWTVTYDSSGKFYKICQKTNQNMCLDVQDSSTANGGNVQVWAYETGGSNQRWTIAQNTDYGRGYRIMPQHTGGKSLDIVNQVYELSNGANIQIWDNDSSPVQSWVFLPYTESTPGQESEYVITNGDYVIAAEKNSNYYLDIYGVTASNGTNVQLTGETAPANVADYDVWTVTYNSSGKFYKICQKTNTNICLDVQNASAANGGNVQVQTYANSSNQQWTITQNTDYGRGYRIMPRHTGNKSLDIVNQVYELTSGANIQIWDNDSSPVQSWVFIPYTGSSPSQDSEYVISNGDYIIASEQNSNYYLDIYGITASNGTNVQLTGETAPANVGDYDVWTVTYNSSSKFYKICQRTDPNMCLDVQNASTANGGNVQVQAYTNSSSQHWTIAQNTNYGRGYRIMPQHTGNKSLDIVNQVYELTSGANIQIWDNDSSPVQSWVFIPYSGNNFIYNLELVEAGNNSLRVAGWVFNNSSPSRSVYVDVYMDGPAGSGQLIGSVLAESPSQDVNNAYSITGNHRFDHTITGLKSGNHTFYLYIVDTVANVNAPFGNNNEGTINIPSGDPEPPIISNVTVTDITSRGYRVTANVSDNVGVVRVAFPTWTKKTGTDGNAQDDIIWHEGSITDGVAAYYVNTTEHNHESGSYVTHIYAFDAEDNYSTGSVEVDVPNPITNVQVSNISSAGYTVTCTLDPLWGAVKVEFPTWSMNEGSDGNPQDDIVWDQGTISGSTVTYNVKTSDHNNEHDCYYRTHIYASDSIDRTAGGVTQSKYSCLEVFVPSTAIAKPTIDSNKVFGYDKGITLTIVRDTDVDGYGIAVYDVTNNNQKVNPTIDAPVNSGSTTTINIHGSDLVNGNVYKLVVYSYKGSGSAQIKSGTVSVYAVPNTQVKQTTAQPINAGVRVNSKHIAGTSGIRYYVYDSSTGKQVAKVTLEGENQSTVISDLVNGKLYYVYSRPYTMYKDKYRWGPQSNKVYFVPVASPSGSNVLFTDPKTAVISTSANSTADGIRVLYRAEGGDLQNGCEAAAVSCSISGLNNKTAYEFYLMRYKSLNGVKHYGAGITFQYSPLVLASMAAPQDAIVSYSGDTFTIKITKSADAHGISVLYRANEGDFVSGCENASDTCSLILDRSKEYTFYVMQFKVVDGKNTYSKGIVVKNVYGTKDADGLDIYTSVSEEIDEDLILSALSELDVETQKEIQGMLNAETGFDPEMMNSGETEAYPEQIDFDENEMDEPDFENDETEYENDDFIYISTDGTYPVSPESTDETQYDNADFTYVPTDGTYPVSPESTVETQYDNADFTYVPTDETYPVSPESTVEPEKESESKGFSFFEFFFGRDDREPAAPSFRNK